MIGLSPWNWPNELILAQAVSVPSHVTRARTFWEDAAQIKDEEAEMASEITSVGDE